MKRVKARQAGFNLIEVMFALLLLGLVISISVETSAGDIAGYKRMRDGSFARWVALNQVAEVQLSKEFPAEGKESGEAEMGGIDWKWQQEIVSAPNEDDLRKIQVSVYQAGQPDELVSMQVGYVANPQPKPRAKVQAP
ncbi:MAG: type II secretion system minor pseudopilin GspI [Thiothrix sp.]|uniref:type II secretion system minor pseudopilin GspI n=1 Tax=Thiothrix sp. TaxID=1032 RepID=UPI0026237C1A|nr:type II secretion system minor pseudopilin GspI [Thiothrix sp.]MDD5393305.1 type II secretion system minor pseudopilin GspI [Thiothrix sp.]